MNRNHWSGWPEAELAHMRSARRMRSSRRAEALPAGREAGPPPGVTAEARVLLAELHRNPESAYPWWLSKVQDSSLPAEWPDAATCTRS